MPSPDYNFRASIAIGCEGLDEGRVGPGPAGPRRSRDGADLENVLADVEYWADTFCSEESDTTRVTVLVNPGRVEVLDAIAEAVGFLRSFRGHSEWGGGQIDLAFSGHGTGEGHLELADGEVAPHEVVQTIAEAMWSPDPDERSLRVGTIFDSCHSGKTLSKILLHPLHGSHFLIIDGFAASLHDEDAWELDSFGHGALTYTMRNPGNQHVDRDRLARAVEEQDEEYIHLALQGFVPNPVTYLTEGNQHSIDLINGGYLEVDGCGAIDVRPDTELNQLFHYMEKMRAQPKPSRRITLES